MAIFLGVDTGGTFTDFLLYDSERASMRLHKVLSTPSAPERAILQGIKELGVETDGLVLVHGSTVATNAVLEGKVVRTAYISNRGLADVLSIGRQARAELYNLTPFKTPPLISAEYCLEVDSRLSAQAEPLEQIDAAGLQQLKLQLEALAPEAVAINLLFSFLDDSEEKAIEAIIPKAMFISRSSDVLPEYKEYERGITTVLNASVGPLMQGYLQRLQQQLAGCRLSIMQSSGGTASVEHAGRYPVHLLLSGPAGGLKGAQFVAAHSGHDRLLTFDMGGTSTDVSIIDQQIGLTSEAKIAGYPVSVPMVDMHTIGAGGGSIAAVDAGGMLLVGPESAGAAPGPACYGNGGMQPTVTDANVVLGRLLPEAFLGGGMRLDKNAATKSVKTLADKLGMSIEQAAKGVIDVINDHMVRALRVMSVQRGEDPKDYTLVSFGGAGGLHVCALADALEMQRALVPVNAGVLSALGMLAAEPSRERSRTINRCLSNCDEAMLAQEFEQLQQLAEKELRELVHDQKISTHYGVDCRYKGQSHPLNLPWLDDASLQDLEQAFHQAHEKTYGHQLAVQVELVNLRVQLNGEKPDFKLPEWQAEPQQKIEQVPLVGIEQMVSVYQRQQLQIGQCVQGPALIVETTSTTWLDQGWSAEVDGVGNLVLTK
ncbi:MAG: hydantoinase/oxoprolinase family protein [Gammaproteobacteria bacterium]|nr:hydantoinase/oxoprolinase family protein [Gammaproteobacteria bacterium]